MRSTHLKKPKFDGESRDERFFTVIWVAESRRKEALDQFFLLIGKEQCSKIEVVASDLHEGYAASIREHCPNATHVLDRFHLMQLFEEAVNDTRKMLHEEQERGSELNRLSMGKDRFVFVKKTYFRYKVTSALSEGINNVIKLLKRRAFEYRNMEYFRLKIMQVCGYLNSRFIPFVNSLTYT